jgi:hypothetical protein
MRVLAALALLGWLAACSSSGMESARTESSVVNGGGAANTGVLNGNHMPSPGGG